MSKPETHSILPLRASELGPALLKPLSAYPNTAITIIVRNPTCYTSLANANIFLTAIDIEQTGISTLAKIFWSYNTIISCTDFNLSTGSQEKLAASVLRPGNCGNCTNIAEWRSLGSHCDIFRGNGA